MVDGLLELGVGLLLNSLGVLQLLDEFHLEHLHLHDLGLFLLYYFLLLSNLTSDVLSCSVNLGLSKLFDLGSLEALVLLLDTVRQVSLSLLLLQLDRVARLVLLVDELGLLGFFSLMKKNGLLHATLISHSLSPHGSHVLALSSLPPLVLEDQLLLALCALLVSELGLDNIVGTTLGLLDLLPRFHFLLLQKCDTVRQQLGVFLDAADTR